MSNRTAGLLRPLGATIPVVAAPMAGGPSRPELVLAAAAAGATGFLAAGYKTPEDLAAQITQVQRASLGAHVHFGVNLFVPNPVPISPEELARHRAAVQRWLDGESRGEWADAVELPEPPGLAVSARRPAGVSDAVWEDFWEQKLAVLEAHPVPLVSLTFGLPSAGDIARLQATGAQVLQTVTSEEEAAAAAGADVDGLIVQSSAAGGHSGTWTPQRGITETDPVQLLHAVRARTELPLWAAGGLSDPAGVEAVLDAGAEAAVVGTALLRCPESGTQPAHQQALETPPGGSETIMTTAFSGRPARALRNSFTDALTETAPLGFPTLHHLSAGLRRAAGAAGDPEGLNLWAGTGFAQARAEPAARALHRLAGDRRL